MTQLSTWVAIDKKTALTASPRELAVLLQETFRKAEVEFAAQILFLRAQASIAKGKRR